MFLLFRSRFVTENRQVACSSHARHFCRNCPPRINWESLKSADRGVGRNANWVSHPATPKLAPIQPRTSLPELPCNGESAIASMWICCDGIFCLFRFTRTSASRKCIVHSIESFYIMIFLCVTDVHDSDIS